MPGCATREQRELKSGRETHSSISSAAKILIFFLFFSPTEMRKALKLACHRHKMGFYSTQLGNDYIICFKWCLILDAVCATCFLWNFFFFPRVRKTVGGNCSIKVHQSILFLNHFSAKQELKTLKFDACWSSIAPLLLMQQSVVIMCHSSSYYFFISSSCVCRSSDNKDFIRRRSVAANRARY